MNLFTLAKTHLRDRETCLNWIREEGMLLPKEIPCPRYRAKGQDKIMAFEDHGSGRYICNENHGNRGRLTITATQGSWFENVKIPPQKVILLVYCFANKYHYDQTIRESSIGDTTTSSATVADWYSYCREVCMCALDSRYEEEGQIGPGHVVEIDESKAGKRKYNRGRLREGYWVLRMID